MVHPAASGLVAAKFPFGPNRIQLRRLRNHVPMSGCQKRVPITCSVKFPKMEGFRHFTKRAVDFWNSYSHMCFYVSVKGLPVQGIWSLCNAFPTKEIERVPLLHFLLVVVKEALKCYLLAWIAFHLLSDYSNRVFGSKRFLIPFSIFVGKLLSEMIPFKYVQKKKDGQDNEQPLSEYRLFSLEAGVSLCKME